MPARSPFFLQRLRPESRVTVDTPGLEATHVLAWLQNGERRTYVVSVTLC